MYRRLAAFSDRNFFLRVKLKMADGGDSSETQIDYVSGSEDDSLSDSAETTHNLITSDDDNPRDHSSFEPQMIMENAHVLSCVMLSGCCGYRLQTLALAYTVHYLPIGELCWPSVATIVLLISWMCSGLDDRVPGFFNLGLYLQQSLSRTGSAGRLREGAHHFVGAFAAASVLSASPLGAVANVLVAVCAVYDDAWSPSGVVRSFLEIKKYLPLSIHSK